MTNPVGPPAAPNIQNIAERAERIVKRAENATQDEAQNIGEKQGAEKKAPPSDARPVKQNAVAEKIPADLENSETPKNIEGRVISVSENNIRIETPAGTVRVKTDQPPAVRSQQKITVTIPPKSYAGDVVQITYIPQSPDIKLPPNVQLPPSSATRDYPPVQPDQIILATPQPISNYTAFITATALPTPANYSPQELLPRVEALAQTLDKAAVTMTVPQQLKTVIQGFDLANLPLNYVGDVAPVPRPYTMTPIKTISAENTAPTDASENVLTQAPLRPAGQDIQKTQQKFSTNLIAALTEIEAPIAQPQSYTPFETAAAKPVNVLRSFQTANVMAVIEGGTSKNDVQNKVAEALSKNLAQSQNTKPARPQQSGEIVLANVVGATQNGQTIISLPPAKNSEQNDPRLMYIQTQVFAPEGTQLLINLSEIPIGNLKTSDAHMAALPQHLRTQISAQGAVPASAMAAALPPAMLQPAFAQSWPALQETLDTLARAAPQAAQNLQSTLPSPSPRMVASALFFIAALKLGNIENWLGNKTLDAIESAGKKGLIERLAGDFGRISSNAGEQTSGQWKTLTLPMLFEGEISNIQLHVRADDQKKDDEEINDIDGIKKTRFVLDLELSRMGPMQIDGFLTSKTLDLILRNQSRLPQENRQDLMKVFADTLDLTGLKGSLSFQNKTQNWVDVSRA